MKITINLEALVERITTRRARERALRAAGVAVLRDWKGQMSTSPINQFALQHGAAPVPPRQARPGEVLYELMRGHDRIRCELRDHGPIYGVEVQFYVNEEFSRGRRFDPRLDPSRPSRELAIAWAEDERRALETAP